MTKNERIQRATELNKLIKEWYNQSHSKCISAKEKATIVSFVLFLEETE